MSNDIEFRSDGRVVWVNTVSLIGRFSKMGIDVHVDGACIPGSCISGPCTLEHWRKFQALMLEHHGVEVWDKHMPKYLVDPGFWLIECGCGHSYVRSAKQGTCWDCPACYGDDDYDNLFEVPGPERSLTREEANELMDHAPG